ncbi:bifunctional DNA-formamidopyrimidine glycosylase/DNA-(apurinic or apyrimidinic site) lyase [Pollutimonas harenae]|uniref:Formamidopyrimidine-DNA glycosylase n=1 Tax=Pollutimonas harenae TaxID=657015 RepID=A0A853GXL1_9BURK|nr:bifunctional DNA-formamidopyrimidine glycosylase/DNA-(apurinic or apyrimidinic site) lyase [Pollutimonas harenae]NYT86887.1 bifunctional DNA-formamidopyrimidine glycosylase/DNA-(apurinic or apyrimidinic site) lyase [Pollutimonas harenae]TEA69398.1 bifunctional DNA-formamidopyrimidine glycosylase/DNA-(apurinic or apyrimidinic site) lyase [Pollutimonas harenae]
MPELPEVETTRRGIATIMTGKVLQNFVVYESRMRWPIPDDLATTIAGRRVLSCGRRGKYLLINFEHGTQIVHLGMSGSLRRVPVHETRRKHDHAEWIFEEARFLLHDPRRFGAVLWHDAARGPVDKHPLLAKLGIEPFDTQFTPDYLYQRLRGRTQAIKQTLLAGDIVVGVGNIYASESLFLARINPRTAAGSLSRARCQTLTQAIQDTLHNALESGGSTLRDYVNATGEPGAYFALHSAVYEKSGQPCLLCATPIKRIIQGQRATYYCPKCQRR